MWTSLSHPIKRPARRPSRIAAAGLVALLAGAVVAPPARAQARDDRRAEAAGVISGVVREARGAPVVGAQVTVAPVTGGGLTIARAAVTDDAGQFRVPGMPDGRVVVAVRRIGFQPATVEVTLPAGEVTIPLVAVPTQLSTVVVRGSRHGPYTGYLADFNRRRDLAIGGRFLTAEDIDRRHPINTTDLLRTVAGVTVAQRGPERVVRMRSNSCDPLVWIDGFPATAGYLDVDAFAPQSLAGIEIYSGVATVPAELRTPDGQGSCGVIALWTRLPEPRPRRSKNAITAEQLAALVASASLYTADQVDRAATLDTTQAFDVAYPDSLRRASIPGTAVVEFVVDTAGRVEPETIGVVTATHPRFAQAAQLAARQARFIPAEKAGHRVRQLIQLPLRWEAER